VTKHSTAQVFQFIFDLILFSYLAMLLQQNNPVATNEVQTNSATECQTIAIACIVFN